MNEHVSIHHSETEEPSTYTKSILLHDDRSPSSRRTGSVDSYATSEGTSYYDDSSPNEPAPLSTVLEHEPKMNGTGLGINGGMKRDESTVTVASSPSSEIEGDAPPAEDIGEGLDAAKEPGPTTAPPLAGALASRMAYVGGALAPRAGPPSPPLLIIPGANSLPNSPDPSRITSIQARRLTIPHSMTPGNSPASPLSGRRGFSRPDIGDLPSSSSMRITPAVLLTPVVPRPLTLFPLPPVTPIIGEDAEQQARRARRIVPVLMSPGVQEDQEGGGSSSPGTSDDEGEESDGTSEEGTSTEGDARSTRSSSEGSSNIAISEGAGPPARERTESTATSWSTATAHTLRRRGSTGQPMTSIMAAMAPLTRPTTSAESDETQRPDGTPTPGPSKDMKAKERDYFTSKSPTPNAGTERSPLHTPKPKSSTRARGVTDVDGRPRPGLYHQKSQSLVDLTADTRKVILPEAAPKAPKPQTIPEDEVLVPKPVATLKRQTSLPAVNPPAYSPPHPHSVVGRSSAREEEGKEKLPTYSCGVHIEGTLQRKMEFSAPGVQARDRSWKKYWFELHGSCLKVFRTDLRKVPVKGYLAWDGKGCAEAGSARHVHLPEGVLETKDRVLRVARLRSRLEEERRARRASLSSTTTESRRMSTTSASSQASRSNSLASSPPSSARRSSISSNPPSSISPSTMAMNGHNSLPGPPSPERPGPSPFEKLSPPPTGVSVPALRDREAKSVPSSANSTSLRHPHLPSFHHGNAMLRHYTMQGAESGLGADYKKRKNVIRVRAEGEQFLLQADTLVDVVNWIEAFQAATNIALDLDERPMPKLPTLPRRRRRRRNPDGTVAPSTAHSVPTGTAAGTNASAGTPPRSAASTSRS